MIEIGKLDGKLRLALFLAAMVMVCFSLSLFRYVYTGTNAYLFLNWNLFLAAIPWVATSLVDGWTGRRVDEGLEAGHSGGGVFSRNTPIKSI